MDIQGITTTQILTVGIFLVGLIFLQIFITKNKSKFSSKWGGNKRIHIVEEKALSTTEKIRIISIDNSEFLLISNKGKRSSFLNIDSDLKINKKKNHLIKPIQSFHTKIKHQKIRWLFMKLLIKIFQ